MKTYISSVIRPATFVLRLMPSIVILVSLNTAGSHCPAQEVAIAEFMNEGLNAGPDDPQMQILKQYVHVSCALVRRVCVLSENQEQQLAMMNDAWLAAELKKASGPQNEGVAGGFAQLFGFAQRPRNNRQQQPHEQCDLVRKEVDKQIDSALEPDQVIQYKEERDARDTFRRESQAGVIVSILDRRLYLTEEQRIALKPAIAASLQKDIAWTMYLQNEKYIPAIPQSVYTKVLDKKQLDSLSQWRNVDFDAHQNELQLIQQQEQIVIEK